MGFVLEKKILLYFFVFLFNVFSSASGRNGNEVDFEWRSATATYSKDSELSSLTGGACGFSDLDKAGYGRLTTGLSSALFDRGSKCGACFEIRCVNHIHWCLQGSPSIVVTATDFCAPNWGLPDDYGGWCNFPREHFEMSESSFASIAKRKADIIPIQYRKIKCTRTGGMRFTLTGNSFFHQVLITNVGSDGQISTVKIKGSKTGWIQMGRNWGGNWQCDADLRAQPLSFEVVSGNGLSVTSYNVVPAGWKFGQTFEGKQFLS
ncbi:hypothetical protein LUZ60_017083 [Juncus effusus]|nr:hypothetical protein LUZ60_017083 [Juncus effusus]